jgi:hypothetical protein
MRRSVKIKEREKKKGRQTYIPSMFPTECAVIWSSPLTEIRDVG